MSFLLISCGEPSLKCTAGWLPASSAHFRACLKSGAFPVPVQTSMDWSLDLTDLHGGKIAGAAIGIGGGMPEHSHGLPTAPLIGAMSQPGAYVLQGISFNMPGRWQIRLKVNANGVMEDLVFNIEANLPEPN